MTGRSAEPEQMRRLFIAVDPPPEAVADLGEIVDGLEVSRANAPGRSTRVTPRDRWHITVAFLGEVPVRRIDAAAAAVETAARGRHRDDPLDPVRVRLAGGGTFGRGASTILWVGMDGDLAGLRRVAEGLRRELRRAHLPFDHKPFRPHLTISRPGARVDAERIAADVAALSAYSGPDWTVEALHLYLSETVAGPGGPQPRYTRLASGALP